MPPDEIRLLQQDAQALGLTLDDGTAQRLLDYLALLAKWNKVYNLTALRDPAQMRVQHLLDSLSVVGPLRRHTGGRALRLLDVGSGGGLPGVVIALTCPEIEVSCVDTVGKKAAFVQQVAAELRIPNLRALHARVETLPPAPGWSVITARAFSSLPDLVALTRDLLTPDGVWAAMKAQHPAEELAALPDDITVDAPEALQVPHLDAQRCLIWMHPRRG
jgi:16S rRNA (guanine527-N7)-methyltransferase